MPKAIEMRLAVLAEFGPEAVVLEDLLATEAGDQLDQPRLVAQPLRRDQVRA